MKVKHDIYLNIINVNCQLKSIRRFFLNAKKLIHTCIHFMGIYFTE